MHLAQLALGECHADTGQINRLPTGHTGAARRARQQTTQGGLLAGRDGIIVRRQQFKRHRLQGVTGEHGAGLAKFHMHGGFTPAQHVVVHTRQVVVHQRICMDQFHRTGGAQRNFGRIRSRWPLAAGRLRRRQHQQGTQALATVQHRVTHGSDEFNRGATLGISRCIGPDPALQRTLDVRQMQRAPGAQVECSAASHSGVHVLSVPWSSTLIWLSTASSRSRQNLSNSAPRWY